MYNNSPSGDTLLILLLSLVLIAFFIACIVAVAEIYVKAGKPWWTSLIPFYSLYILLKIIGRPGWWILLYFIPFANIVVQLINAIDLAKVFGRSVAFGVIGLWLFSLIGYLILGFGKSKYVGPTNTTTAAATQTPVAPTLPPQTPNAPTPTV